MIFHSYVSLPEGKINHSWSLSHRTKNCLVGGDWNMAGLWLSIQLGMENHPHWRTPSFFRGVVAQPPTSWCLNHRKNSHVLMTVHPGFIQAVLTSAGSWSILVLLHKRSFRKNGVIFQGIDGKISWYHLGDYGYSMGNNGLSG